MIATLIWPWLLHIMLWRMQTSPERSLYRKGQASLVGSGIGGMETIEKQMTTLIERGPRRVSPFMIPSLIANIAGGVIAIDLGAQGPNFSVVSACASGSHAIGEAFEMIRRGVADMIFAGGSEAAVTRIGFAGFSSMKAMSTNFNDDPSRASPFDSQRDGFVMGGSRSSCFETKENAEKRGARIYAEIAGYSATCDAFHVPRRMEIARLLPSA